VDQSSTALRSAAIDSVSQLTWRWARTMFHRRWNSVSTCKSYDLSALRDLITACYAILIFITRDSRISTQDWTGINTLLETRHSELKRVSFEVTLSAEILILSYFPRCFIKIVLKSFSILFSFLILSSLCSSCFVQLSRFDVHPLHSSRSSSS
jgi:hypothetical protein